MPASKKKTPELSNNPIGKKIPVKPYGYGEMVVLLPRGSYSINAEFKDTPIRNAGNILSLVGVFILLGYVYAKHRHR